MLISDFYGVTTLRHVFNQLEDDPYHNSKWRELYPEENLEEIKKLALAGEASKTRYVYALHPFMHNAMRFILRQ